MLCEVEVSGVVQFREGAISERAMLWSFATLLLLSSASLLSPSAIYLILAIPYSSWSCNRLMELVRETP